MSADNLTLAGEFATPTREQWLALVGAVLKGSSFDETLVTRLYDGVAVQPLYTEADAVDALPGMAPFVRGSRPAGQLGGWDVRGYHADPDPAATNAAILADLERGVTSIWLRVGGNGVPVDALDRALEGVYLDLAPIVLEIGGDALPAIDALVALWSARGVPGSAAVGNLGLDPEGGQIGLDDAAGIARRVAHTHRGVRSLVVDGTAINARGGSDVDELGCVLAVGANYLRALTAEGGSIAGEPLDIDSALGQIEFRLAATNDQFSTIAKMRAARRLWCRVAEVCGASANASAMHQHAVTSRAMHTQRDPWVNILRGTVACFAAGVGGADAITVLPFDDALGLPDAFARRVARNTQAVLINESNAARVIDPAGGSWYIESLTNDFARAAWEWFQAIEADPSPSLISQRVARTRDARAAKVARRRQLITGVTEFPDIGEARVTRDRPPATTVERYAEPFEALRDRSDAAATADARPAIFLANLGPLATHAARNAFANTFFQIAGFATPSSEPLDDAAAAARAFGASGATHVVICSSDKLYDVHAVAVAEALRGAGATRIYLAGNPGDNRERYVVAGIDEFIYVGCDALDVLGRALETMGVA